MTYIDTAMTIFTLGKIITGTEYVMHNFLRYMKDVGSAPKMPLNKGYSPELLAKL